MSENKRTKRICALCFTTDSTISYFSFPSNERRNQWLRLCNITRELPRTAKLCAKHFSSDSFTRNKENVKSKPRLKVDALPSQNLDVQHNDKRMIHEHEQDSSTTQSQSRWCFICGSVKDPKGTRSYHKFPKESERRMLWLSRLGIEESSNRDFTFLRLCNLHFSSESIVENPLTGKRILTRNALPIDTKEHPASSEDYHHYDDELETTEDTLTLLPADFSTVANNLAENRMESEISVDVSMNSEISVEEDWSSNPLQPESSQKKLSVSTFEKACQTEEDLITVANCEKNIAPDTELLTTTPTSSNYCQDQLQDHFSVGPSEKSSKLIRPFPRYVGDIRTPHLATPGRAKRCLNMTKDVIEQKNKTIAALSRKLKTAQKQIETLKDLIDHLRTSNYITDEASNNLMVTTPDALKAILLRGKEGKRKKFSAELRRFALQLQFYSNKAYTFVRKTFGKLLPSPSTLRKYCCSIEMQPGISREVLQTLQKRGKNSGKDIICNLVIDEMALKEHTNRKADKRYGYVNLGVALGDNFNRDYELIRANHALVFLLVALNDNYKVPVAYFLIRNLSACERANLVRMTLQLLQEYNINVHSITYDGAAVNNSMANKLGAIMDLEAPKHKFHFLHPVTGEKVYIFLDPCHMLKNVRNAFGTTYQRGKEEPFQDGHGRKISWKNIVDLNEIQKKEGLRLANKITDRHINYQENIMSVRLAAQTLSNSVGDALKLLKDHNDGFQEADGTIEFCKHFNDIFDLLNCRTRYRIHTLQQPMCVPLTQDNFQELKTWSEEQIEYIQNLRDENGTLLIHFSRKRGFQGFVVCLRNIFHLYEDLHEKYGLEYLLTYKILQDMIENLFSAVRMMGGFQNNPSPYQFQTAIRRILIHHELVYSYGANCRMDDIHVLNVSSSVRRVEVEDTEDDSEDPDEFLDLFNFQNVTIPSNFVQYVVNYISGYIIYKFKLIRSSSSCQECFDAVTGEAGSAGSRLIDIKNRGPLCYASEMVISLCTHLETVIRAKGDDVLREGFSKRLTKEIEAQPFLFFNNTHFENNPDHALILSRYVTKLYLTVRLHHEEAIRNQVTKYIRKVQTKLILFKHQ